MLNPDIEISKQLRQLAASIDETLIDIAGEKSGFVLITSPLDRHGTVNYISNVNRDSGEQLVQLLKDHWASQMPDIPAHEKS